MGVEVQVSLFNIKTYREQLLPAYKKFIDDRDPTPLAALLRRAMATPMPYSTVPRISPPSVDVLSEHIGVLQGTIFYSSTGVAGKRTSSADMESFVDESVTPELAEILCVEQTHDVNPEQSMSHDPLISYLYSGSEWIRDVFTFAKGITGGSLEIRMGDSSELFTREETQRFYDEVVKVGTPDSRDTKLLKDYDNLRKMLKTTLDDPDLALVLTVT